MLSSNVEEAWATRPQKDTREVACKYLNNSGCLPPPFQVQPLVIALFTAHGDVRGQNSTLVSFAEYNLRSQLILVVFATEAPLQERIGNRPLPG